MPKLDLNDTQTNFDDTSLYPSALYDENSVCPIKETDCAFKPHMSDIFVIDFINKTFNQNENDSETLKIYYYNPLNLMFQHLPIREKVENVVVNRMRNSYTNDTLKSVDNCEKVKVGGKVNKNYEGVNHRENFKKSHFKKIVEKLFLLQDKNTKTKVTI